MWNLEHSEPADVGVYVLNHFKLNEKDFTESCISEVKNPYVTKILGVSGVRWLLVERFEHIDFRVNKNMLRLFIVKDIHLYAQEQRGLFTKHES